MHPHVREAARLVVEHVFPEPSTDTLHNPYTSTAGRDEPRAPMARRVNLLNHFNEVAEPRYLIVGEAPGPWGARHSGVAFTSERQILRGDVPFYGGPTTTDPDGMHETSADIFWRTLGPRTDTVLWNATPYYPHEAFNIDKFRQPSTADLAQHRPVLGMFARTLRPAKVIAVGRVAEKTLTRAGIACTYVRHPSHGGMADFADGIREHIGESEQ